MLFYDQLLVIQMQQKELEKKSRDAWKFFKQPEMNREYKSKRLASQKCYCCNNVCPA